MEQKYVVSMCCGDAFPMQPQFELESVVKRTFISPCYRRLFYNLTQRNKTQNSTSGPSLNRRLGSFHRAKVVSMCSRVAVMLSQCSLSLSLSPSSWGCQGALVCAGRPRGLVLEAFLQQTRQQASVFESPLEIVRFNSQKCPNLCPRKQASVFESPWEFCISLKWPDSIW